MNYPNTEFVELSKDLFKKGASFSVTVKGKSMFPLLKEGNIITIAPLETKMLKPYDIVLYRNEDNRPIIHRVIRIDTDAVFIKGDFTVGEASRVACSDILGKITFIRKKRYIINLGKKTGKVTSIFCFYSARFILCAKKIAGRCINILYSMPFYRSFQKKIFPCVPSYQWAEFDDTGHCLRAVYKGSTIGSLTLIYRNDASVCRGWWIFDTWVYWRYRGRNIGLHLVEYAQKRASSENKEPLYLLLFKDNGPALALYKKMGFRECHNRLLEKEIQKEYAPGARPQKVMVKSNEQR